jgi:hypothetical protein
VDAIGFICYLLERFAIPILPQNEYTNFNSFFFLVSHLHLGILTGLDHFDAFHLGNSATSKGLFGDSIVSIWLSQSFFLPVLNLALIFVPLPSIFYSIRPTKDTTEDMMFVFSIISAVSIIGSNIWSIRLSGLLGVILGTHSCNEIGLRRL